MAVKCINCQKNKGTYCEADMWFQDDGHDMSPDEIQDHINTEIFCSEYELKSTK